jgi:MFS family permease
MTDARRSERVLRLPSFAAYWSAATIGGFGTFVTMVAMQVLVVTTLDATPTAVGLINAVQFLPYLLLGLVAGSLIDRWRRKPVLVCTAIGRSLLLLTIPVLWTTGMLTLPVLAVVLFAFGTLALFGDAASQAFLPRLVPRESLLAANARLDQSLTVAQTSGPVIGGGLVGLLGAPLAVLVDAVAYAVSAVLVGRIRIDEPMPDRTAPRPHLLRSMGEGLRWVYRHRTLAPMAWSTHVWFLGHSILFTAFAPFALRPLGLSPLEYGIVLALAGVGGLAGATIATRLGSRIGAGNAILLGKALIPVAWVPIALAPPADAAGAMLPLLVVGVAQLVHGFSMGVENANEMGYRQAVTPDALQGRMNATMRSINRSMVVVGALTGGILADVLGYRPTIWIGIGVFVVAAIVVALSPLRSARHGEQPASQVAPS